MIAILEKTEHNIDFHQTVNFIKASHIRYALTINPTVYVSHIRQFWSTARIKTTNEETKILAIVDGKPRTISESSLRRHLKLNDAEGISSLPDTELFENLSLIGYNILLNQRFTFQKGQFSHQWKFLIHTIMQCLNLKSIGFNEFSSNIATVVVCLATNRVYKFSKMIFDGMVRNVNSKGSKFLMYTRNDSGNGSHDLGCGDKRTLHTARRCTYKEFLNCQPLNFKGTEGGEGLAHWFEKIEYVIHISNCAIEFQKSLMKMMIEAYYPRSEIKKLDMELWNLTVKGATQQLSSGTSFALTVAKYSSSGIFITGSENALEHFISNNPPLNLMLHLQSSFQNQMLIWSARPKMLQEAIELENNLMDQKKSLMKMMIEAYYPRSEIKKLDIELWNLTVKGIEKYKVFSIVSKPVYDIIYKNNKKEKRVTRIQEVHKFCDATLKRVLEGLNSYNNDVNHGYVTLSLSNEDAEYLQLFEEEIKERLKHRDRIRR
nr:hypothetical protein [Tanacetum cinerariifolium]